MKRTCLTPGCTRKAGLTHCYAHTPGAIRNARTQCAAPSCGNLRAPKGPYCEKHRKRLHRHGDLEVPNRPLTCAVAGCDEIKDYGRRVCRRHYNARCRERYAARRERVGS